MRLRWGSILPMVCASLILCQTALPQKQLDGRLGHERLVAVVPMIGTGSYEDPMRPAYVPEYLLPTGSGRSLSLDGPGSPLLAARRKGEAPQVIVGFSYELSDNGKFALILFQATDRAAFAPLLAAAKTPFASSEAGSNRNALEGGFDLRVFEVGKVKRDDLERELRKYKGSFRLDKVGGGVQ